jgi:hypothetical protein
VVGKLMTQKGNLAREQLKEMGQQIIQYDPTNDPIWDSLDNPIFVALDSLNCTHDAYTASCGQFFVMGLIESQWVGVEARDNCVTQSSPCHEAREEIGTLSFTKTFITYRYQKSSTFIYIYVYIYILYTVIECNGYLDTTYYVISYLI